MVSEMLMEFVVWQTVGVGGIRAQFIRSMYQLRIHSSGCLFAESTRNLYRRTVDDPVPIAVAGIIAIKVPQCLQQSLHAAWDWKFDH